MRANEPLCIATAVARMLLGGVLLGAGWTPIWAQSPATTRPVTVVVSGGASVPVGGFKDYNDLGVHADVSLLVRIAGQSIRLRPEFSYSRFSLKDASGQPLPTSSFAAPNRAVPGSVVRSMGAASSVATSAAYGSSDASTLLGLLGNVEIPLTGGLYLLGGVGATNVKSGASNSTTDVSQTALTYNGGAGIRFRLGGISGFVEGRLKDIAVDKGKALFSDVKTVPVSFGVVF